MSKETDDFKKYLNSILGEIDDKIHEELWDKLTAITQAQCKEINQGQTLPIDSVGVSANKCSEQFHVLTRNMGNGKCSECGGVLTDKNLNYAQLNTKH